VYKEIERSCLGSLVDVCEEEPYRGLLCHVCSVYTCLLLASLTVGLSFYCWVNISSLYLMSNEARVWMTK